MKIKKIDFSIENILWMFFLIIFIYAVLVVGSPIHIQPRLLYIIINIFFLIMVFYAFIKKQKINITKYDILLLIITLSTFLPLMFRTSVSLQETINGIVKYLSIFELYICYRIIPKNEKRTRQIENTIIFLAIILIIFGIDIMTYNKFEPVYKILDKVEVFVNPTYIKRMGSLFEYANTFAILIASSFMITLKRVFEDKKIVLINICLFIQMFAILTSKSRFTIILLFIATIIYFISLRKKIDIKKQILKIFLIGLITIIYDTIFEQYLQNCNNINIIISLSITIGTIIVFSLLYYKIKDRNINYKIIYLIIFLLIMVIALDLIINTELVIFDKNHTKDQVIKRIDSIKPNTMYEIKFVIDAKTKNYFKDIYSIYIRTNNKNGEIIKREKISFDDFNGEKVYNFKTTEDTEYISLVFRCKDINQSEYLKIKSLSLNGKQIQLEYKILPYKLIERIKNISFNSKSLYERTTMIKDSSKILKNNWVIGQGKDTWKLLYRDVKSYNYGANQLHCFPMNIWLEYGIIPFLIYVYLVFLIIKKLIVSMKNSNTENIAMLLAILLIVFHSILDFDLDFLNMICIFFVMIANIQDNEKKYEFNLNKILITILTIVSTILILFNIGDYIVNKMEEKDLSSINTEEKIDYLNKKVILSPTNYTYKIEYTKALKEYFDNNKNNIDSQTYDKILNEMIFNSEYVLNTEYEEKSNKELYMILSECYSEKILKGEDYNKKLENIKSYI